MEARRREAKEIGGSGFSYVDRGRGCITSLFRAACPRWRPSTITGKANPAKISHELFICPCFQPCITVEDCGIVCCARPNEMGDQKKKKKRCLCTQLQKRHKNLLKPFSLLNSTFCVFVNENLAPSVFPCARAFLSYVDWQHTVCTSLQCPVMSTPAPSLGFMLSGVVFIVILQCIARLVPVLSWVLNPLS